MFAIIKKFRLECWERLGGTLLAINKGWLETGRSLMDSQKGAIREERNAANNLKIRA